MARSPAPSTPRPTVTQPATTTFGKYQILERVASGGMAEIFKARIEGIGGFHRYFAIKRMLPHLSSNPEFVDLLVDEAKVAGLLSHANIVQILDLGRIDEHYYIAMEYVQGQDLGRVLTRCREKGITLPVPHAVFICIEVLKGLEYAHNRQVMRGGRPVPLNIVHRDMSPPNILISSQGEVKITDFGIAKASVKALETQAGVVKGRFDYLSPEQSEGRPVDQRSDLFSTGIVLYEMLVGRNPFRQDSDGATLDAIRAGRYTPASEVNLDIPYSLDVVLEAALGVRPEARYQTATAFKEALDSFFHESGFIFSQSTLAAFLKGLFPENRAGAAARRPEDSTRPIPRGGAPLGASDAPTEEEDFRPTVVQEAPQHPRISPFEPGYAPLDDRPTAQGPSLSDAATLLRKVPGTPNPLSFDPGAGLADAQTLIRGNPFLDAPLGDMETQIKRKEAPRFDDERSTSRDVGDRTRPVPRPPDEGLHNAPTARTQPPPAVFPSQDATLPQASAAPVAQVAPPPRPTPAMNPDLAYPKGPTAIRKKSSSLSQVIYVMGLACVFCLGLVAGYVISARLSSGSGQAGAATDAALLLQVPEGARVLVDDKEIKGTSPLTVPLTPGKASRIRVEASDVTPIEFPVTGVAGQRSVYVVDWKTGEPSGKSR